MQTQQDRDLQALRVWMRALADLRAELEDWDAAPEDGVPGVPPRTVFDFAPVVLGLEYEDADGRESARDVRVSAFVIQAGGQVSLRGYCRTRRAPRQFRLDRIRAIIDGAGEVHADVPGFCDAVLLTGQVRGVTRPKTRARGKAAADRPPKAPPAPAPASVSRAPLRAGDAVKATSFGCLTAVFWFLALGFAFLVYVTWRGSS